MNMIVRTCFIATVCVSISRAFPTHPDQHSAMDEILLANTGLELDNGDERLTKEQKEMFQSMDSNNQEKRALKHQKHNQQWEYGIVPYTIATVFSDDEKEKKIKAAMRKIESVSCIKFIEYSIWNHPHDHLAIISGKGCSSAVGKSNGKTELSLRKGGCLGSVGTAIHEMLHALGFYHEQSRQDRGKYIRVNTENIIPGYEGNFKMAEDSHADGLGVEYDGKSIMHYGSYTFSNNRKPTIEWIGPGNIKYLGGKELTEKDIKQLNLYYKCGTVEPKTKTTTQGIGKPGPAKKLTTTSATITVPPADCKGKLDNPDNQSDCKHITLSNNKIWCKGWEYLCSRTCCQFKL